MQDLMDWLNTNKEWLFSGAGGAAILGILGFFFKKRFSSKPQPQPTVGGDDIKTKGDYSPGKVEGDYTIDQSTHTHEAPKPEPPKKS